MAPNMRPPPRLSKIDMKDMSLSICMHTLYRGSEKFVVWVEETIEDTELDPVPSV